MKRKYFLVGLFLMLVMFLVGCNGNGGSTPPITLNQSPIASFTADPTSGVAPLEVSFNGSSSSDSDGSITSYAWDFKDGNTGTGQTVNHTFSSTGSYNVELTVTDDKGATHSITKTINVTETPNQSPTASFTANPTSGVAPLEVSFNASSSSDSDGSIISYQWDFKDGNTGNGETVNHTFSSTGSYNVKLTVTDNEGATDTTTKNITITETLSNQSPTASFTANPTSGVAPLNVSFNASSSSDPDGTIVSYAWDFKDGYTGNGVTVNHTFNSTGSYNVGLTIKDNEGASDSATKTITVTTAPTIAKLYLVAEDGTYLGKLTTNEFDSDSIFNEYGTYGSKYSSKSIWNEYGTYGSKYSSQSAFNDYTFTPPYIVTSDGTIYGRLTTNKFISGAISPYSIYAILLELGL
ncbi:PKD domain-containing protein [bacterium]|nr:PKD domain-containing protein [bacterium]